MYINVLYKTHTSVMTLCQLVGSPVVNNIQVVGVAVGRIGYTTGERDIYIGREREAERERG